MPGPTQSVVFDNLLNQLASIHEKALLDNIRLQSKIITLEGGRPTTPTKDSRKAPLTPRNYSDIAPPICSMSNGESRCEVQQVPSRCEVQQVPSHQAAIDDLKKTLVDPAGRTPATSIAITEAFSERHTKPMSVRLSDAIAESTRGNAQELKFSDTLDSNTLDSRRLDRMNPRRSFKLTASEKRKTELMVKLEKKRARRRRSGQFRHSYLGFVNSQRFALASAALIVANSVYIGVQTNLQVKVELGKVFATSRGNDIDWRFGDLAFSLVFVFELILRVAADGELFCFGRDWRWNWFDSLVVFAAVLEVVLDFMGKRLDVGISVLRALRVVRIIRLFRAGNVCSSIRNLKTMLYSLSVSSSAFFAALFLLTAVMYIFALFFMQGVLGYLRKAPDVGVAGEMDKYYGSLERTIWSLIGAVTNGYDWSQIASPLLEIGWTYGFVFLMFIVFVTLVLLNILNGIFVHCALEFSAMNRDLAVDRVLTAYDQTLEDVLHIFMEMDADHSGDISWSEFEYYLSDERVKAYFMSLDLDMTSAHKIFEVLDCRKTGSIPLIDFVEGCINLRGAAKMIDVKTMLESHFEDLNSRMLKMEGTLRVICMVHNVTDGVYSCQSSTTV